MAHDCSFEVMEISDLFVGVITLPCFSALLHTTIHGNMVITSGNYKLLVPHRLGLATGSTLEVICLLKDVCFYKRH